MAYTNGFPASYQPLYYPQQYQQTQMPQANQSTGIIWVQGEAGAKSYLVAPNTTVQLWDSEENVIYLKTADSSGMPSMKILDYTIRESNSSPRLKNNTDYVTKTELHEMKTDFEKTIDAMRTTIDQMKQIQQSNSTTTNGLC